MYRRVSFPFVTMKACFMGVRTKACSFFAGHCLLTLFRNYGEVSQVQDAARWFSIYSGYNVRNCI